MGKRSLIEQLDQAIEAMLVRPEAEQAPIDSSLQPLLRVAAQLRELPREGFKARLKNELEGRETMASQAATEPAEPKVDPIRKGFRTVTPYLVAPDGPALLEFAKNVFGAEESFRAIGSAGGIHGEVRIGDGMLMIGGGIPGKEWRSTPKPAALHIYVRDCDATYQRALDAGAASIDKPRDQFYGERSATVKDFADNFWYIATYKGDNYKWEGAPDVQPCLHPPQSGPVIEFLKQAFDAEELGRHASPQGVIRHATVKIGTSLMELGDAHGPYQPMKSMFYLYVPDVDKLYRQALGAGAKSISEPRDQDYGDRSAGIEDPFGNQWFIATHIKDVGA